VFQNDQELESCLQEHISKEMDAECFKTYTTTVFNLREMITKGVGGAIIVIMHDDIFKMNDLQLEPLDGNAFFRVMKKFASNCNKHKKDFKRLLDALTAHTDSDRWEPQDLEGLSNDIPGSAPHVGTLLNQPKDGALLLSHTGELKGASLHIKYKSPSLVLKKADGTSAGTRHASSLGMAEWLGKLLLRFPGIIFTRSDGGGAHAFLPMPNQAPKVVHFTTLHPLDQNEMLDMFRERMRKGGRLMKKKDPALVRIGVKGEEVVTVVNGRITSRATINDEVSYVVQAPTINHEHYVLSEEKFLKVYQEEGHDLEKELLADISDFLRMTVTNLKKRGFKLHYPRPDVCRVVYDLTPQDIDDMGIRQFYSSWGSLQPVSVGDKLASLAPIEDATEVYLMPESVTGCYEEVQDNGQPSRQIASL